MIQILVTFTFTMLLLVGGFFFYPQTAPIVSLGSDSVTPQKVKPGERIEVTRNLRANTVGTVYVYRTMTKGECAKSCEIIDLVNGNLSLQPGDYFEKRDHIIPVTATPGQWKLVFSLHWDDTFGRARKIMLPELVLEIQ